MAATSIEWTHPPGFRGATWNPTKGCRRKSPGCLHCYAERMAFRIVNMGGPAAEKYRLVVKHDENGKPRPLWSGQIFEDVQALEIPLRTKAPTCFFVDSMSDLFDEGVSPGFIASVFGVMAACPQHRFLILTKSAKRMAGWFEWVELSAVTRGGPADACVIAAGVTLGRAEFKVAPVAWPLPNVWLGVSVEDQARADERIPHLLATPAAVRFLSCEPLLEEIDVKAWLWACWIDPVTKEHYADCYACDVRRVEALRIGLEGYEPPIGAHVDWIIGGGESGPRPCDVDWLRALVWQGRSTGAKVFVKQLGREPRSDASHDEMVAIDALRRKRGKGGDMDEWPADLRVREFPTEGL